MRAASYRSDGPFAGRVVHHREISGDQLWTVVVSVERFADGGRVNESHTIMPNQRVPLGALEGLVVSTINELCADKAPITRAKLDFFVRKSPTQ